MPRLPKPDLGRSPLAAEQAIQVLSDDLAKSVNPDRIALLKSVLKAAQIEPPQDKRAFAKAANRLLDVFGLKIEVDGLLYRMHVAPGKGPGFLALLGGGGSRSDGGSKRARGFTRVPFRLVPDPMKLPDAYRSAVPTDDLDGGSGLGRVVPDPRRTRATR